MVAARIETRPETAQRRPAPVRTALDQRAVLVAERLCCRLGGRLVVDEVSLRLQAAEVVGLLGPNGAGKSTLLRLLCGALRAESGTVQLSGQDVTALPLHRRSRLGLGYLPQEPSVFSGLTVRQNVEAALELRGTAPASSRARAGRTDELLAIFGLVALARRRAVTLSGGEQRRLELARLLAIDPQVVLLDEPLAGLDPLAVAELTRQIHELTDRGVGVLLADHRVEHALTICRRACILIEGRVVAEGSGREVLASEQARRSYFGTIGPQTFGE